MRVLKFAAAAALAVGLVVGGTGVRVAHAAEGESLLSPGWSFSGLFGTYDRAAAQRGFQIYKEVCSTCHALSLVTYGDLKDLGFSDDEVKAIAAQYKVPDTNDAGEPSTRPARPSDRFVKPYPNEKAARAALNGANPPDLSLIVKAREGGPNYVYSLLNGYRDAPPGMKIAEGMNYNLYFPGNQIPMPPPLSNGAVTFADGTEASVPQMAHDVVTFLSWAAEPTLEARKRTGVQTLLFLLVFTGMFYAVKRKVWSDVH